MTQKFTPPRLLLPKELALLPRALYEEEILVAETPEEAAKALKRLKGCRVLGFDTETKPCFTRGQRHTLSLVQLAGDELVVLLRAGTFAAWDCLAEILGDAGVVKAGVAVRDDLTALGKIGPVSPRGFEDVGEWAKTLGWPVTGLRNLAASLLGVRVSKKARLTDWAAKSLSRTQVCYAATDAWVSRQIYMAMRPISRIIRAKTLSKSKSVVSMTTASGAAAKGAAARVRS